MKLPKLPMECIQRLITADIQERPSSEFERETILTMVLGFCDPSKYTIEELDKLGILNRLISTSISICDRYELTKEALELFDEIKSNSKALDCFISQINLLGQNLLKDSGVRQYILDTLVGPEWKDPDFYLYGNDRLRLIDKRLLWKKSINSILCDGLCIFNDIPEDRINKFYDALRRLKLYTKHRGFRYVKDNSERTFYKSVDLSISVPERIKQDTDLNMYLEWYIENNQLVTHKTFEIYDYYKYIPRNELEDFLKRLKEKYPKQMQEVNIATGVCRLQWKHSREYNLPDDLRGLDNI